MLFFSAAKCFFIKIKKQIPSPVRNSETYVHLKCLQLGKRVSLPASMSVEAALVLPLCLFSAVILMIPMKLLEDQRRIQAALEQAAREISIYAYAQEMTETGKEIKEEAEGVISLVGIGYVRQQVMKHVDQDRIRQVSFSKTRILEGNDEIRLVMNYRQRLPFSVFGLESIPVEAVSVRRAWVGAPGGRLKDSKGSREEGEDEIVYMGRDGTRYHLDPECHYLHNDIRAISAGQAEKVRNAEGKRYNPCAICGNGQIQGNVYIMPSGSSYHTTPFCSSITAYVRAVKKSEAEYLGVCSYCGGE